MARRRVAQDDPVTLWGGPAPVRRSDAMSEIAHCCAALAIRRPLVVGGPSLTEVAGGLPFLHAIERAGIAVRVFDRARSLDIATVADAVATFHFEACDGVIAVGGGLALEIAKTAALMTGQTRPLASFFEDLQEPGAADAWRAVDGSGVAPWIAVPATPFAATLCGGATVLVDAFTAPRLLRHPGLRPRLTVVDPALCARVPPDIWSRSLAAAVVLAACAELGAVDGSTGRAEVLARISTLPAAAQEACPPIERYLAAALSIRFEVKPVRLLAAFGADATDRLAAFGVSEADADTLVGLLPPAARARADAILRAAGPAPGGAPVPPRRRQGRAGRLARLSRPDQSDG